MIEVKNLTKYYGETLAVDDISFEIKKGEIVGFLGPNGAGKTTTLKILTCYMPPSSGTAFIAGHDIFEESISVRKNIGYLPESNPLYLEMGVVEYLRFIARMRNIQPENINKRIKYAVEICGLKDVIHKDIGELSKGFRQRVGFAQTIIHDPPILIMDEPTVGLDPNQIAEIRDLIKELGKEKTVVLSSHILPEVQATCDKVIIINRGKIVAEGTTEELQLMVQGKEKMYIKLKGDKNDILQKLNAVANVESIAVRDKEADDIFGYVVDVAAKADIRESLYRFSIDNKFPILEMKREIVSLEELFRRLTADNGEKDE